MTFQVFHDLYGPRIHLRKGALGGLRSEPRSDKRSRKGASKQAMVMLIKTGFALTDS